MHKSSKCSVILIALLVILIDFTLPVIAVNNYSVSGYVNNTLDLFIQNARVDIGSEYNFTDTNGYYNFTNVTEGSTTIIVRNAGYQNNTTTVNLVSDLTHNVTLSERTSPMTTPGFEGIFAVITFVLLFGFKPSLFIHRKTKSK